MTPDETTKAQSKGFWQKTLEMPGAPNSAQDSQQLAPVEMLNLIGRIDRLVYDVLEEHEVPPSLKTAMETFKVTCTRVQVYRDCSTAYNVSTGWDEPFLKSFPDIIRNGFQIIKDIDHLNQNEWGNNFEINKEISDILVVEDRAEFFVQRLENRLKNTQEHPSI